MSDVELATGSDIKKNEKSNVNDFELLSALLLAKSKRKT